MNHSGAFHFYDMFTKNTLSFLFQPPKVPTLWPLITLISMHYFFSPAQSSAFPAAPSKFYYAQPESIYRLITRLITQRYSFILFIFFILTKNPNLRSTPTFIQFKIQHK